MHEPLGRSLLFGWHTGCVCQKNDRNHNWVGSHIFHHITICARRSQREGPQPSPATHGTTPSPGKTLRGCILSLQPRAFCRWLGTSLLCSVLSPAICLLGMISPPGCRAMGFVVPLHISGLHSLSWLLLEVSQPRRCCGKQAQGSPTPPLKQVCFSFWKETFLFR